MKPLTVALGDRAYPIYIEPDVLDDEQMFRAAVGARQVMIVSNETVAALYLARVRVHFADRVCETVVLPDGEQFKTLQSMDRIVSVLLEKRFERGCMLLALGGGVIGDVTGFAAACYQRGVDYLQIPTTLLAQVDSSVGGKTAVNHRLGKNMIGAFHQPRAVIADTATLDTLDPREFRAGVAEVIKYGLVRDAGFFIWLEENLDAVLKREPAALSHAIRRSCENKAEVVAADETETGLRAILNLGHTFGHAIENELGYGTWLHGEAVAAGMCLASDLSSRLGWMSTAECKRVDEILARAGLPTVLPRSLGPERMLQTMSRDKKNRDGRIRLVLLRGVGSACITQDYDDAALYETLGSRLDPDT